MQQKFKLPLPFLVEEEKVQNSKKKKKKRKKPKKSWKTLKFLSLSSKEENML